MDIEIKIENENRVNDIEKKVIIDNDRYLFMILLKEIYIKIRIN